MEKKDRSGFLSGAILGLCLGLLIAANSENETALNEKMNHLLELIKDIDSDEVRVALEQKIINLRTLLESLDKEKVLNIAKEKCEIIINAAEELIELSRTTNVLVVEKAATDVKKQTVVFLKELLVRIDEKEELLKKDEKEKAKREKDRLKKEPKSKKNNNKNKGKTDKNNK